MLFGLFEGVLVILLMLCWCWIVDGVVWYYLIDLIIGEFSIIDFELVIVVVGEVWLVEVLVKVVFL